MTEPDRHFGEEGARLTYGSYLRVAELLDQQRVESDPPAHDELLFITIHQVYELWFKLLLSELTDARDRLLAGETYLPRVRLARCKSIEQVLVTQVDVIDSMTPQDFVVFRTKLAPASGFQSSQFREIEFLSGLKDPRFVQRLRAATDEERARLQRRLEEPTLWDGLLATLAARGLPAGDEDEVRRSLVTVAHDRSSYGDLWDVTEGLLSHDELSAQWRALHATVVERQIGYKPGTGGSAGATYLRGRRDLRFFPLLWELRTAL